MTEDSFITPEMEQHFVKRTAIHQDLVKKYIFLAGIFYPERAFQLDKLKVTHDMDKLHAPLREPYICITWKYKCLAEGISYEIPDQIKEDARNATLLHVTTNPHHPEYHDPDPDSLKIGDDRDAMWSRKVDATAMPELSLMEMAADWCAVAQERRTHPIAWLESNLGVRWEFTKDQQVFLREILSMLWSCSK